ncbi:MAG: VWA domain-containing protein [Planctomycetes bacterium]|nr:VWA domain-containing protein [Planctomycetota bacterium]NOG54411.1 VWA domain-containing protein [Planctomycetota bacterium]
MFRFDHPVILWMLLPPAVIVCGYLAWKRLRYTDALRRTTLVVIRSIVFALAALALAGLTRTRTHDRLAVIAVVDLSGSIRNLADLPLVPDMAASSDPGPEQLSAGRSRNLAYLQWWLSQASASDASNTGRKPDDLFGLLVFDGAPYAVSTPVIGPVNDDRFDVRLAPGTNIGEAIELAAAMFPPDVGKRLLLISDGVETEGQALGSATRLAATGSGGSSGRGIEGIPVDVVPIAYKVDNEIVVERVDLPPHARPGQTITVRILIRSSSQATGRLNVLLEGQPVDLNGAGTPGTSRQVTLKPGLNVESALVTLGEVPVNRFEAVFEPFEAGNASASADQLSENNRAEAFTLTSQKGTVLVVDAAYPGDGTILPRTLEEAELRVQTIQPNQFPTNPLQLQAYDLIILQNIPADDFSQSQQDYIAQYVQEFGGGLIMVGGYDALGAGGWDRTAVKDLVPVDMSIPEELRIPTAAIAIVLDKSGSMGAGVVGTRMSQQEIANEGAALALESLDPTDFITVISFSSRAHTVVPMSRIRDADEPAEAIRSITSEGGTNMYPALERAFEQLRDVDAEIKHVVCLSDGNSTPGEFDQLASRMRANDISVSTIAVGNDADAQTLERIAQYGGGEFYYVQNPRILPRIFVKDIRVIRRPLIREKPFAPIINPTGSPLTAGLGTVPPLGGLVLTQPRPEPEAQVLMSTPDSKPILAQWQAGLGRVAVFASDAQDHWASEWIGWPGYRRLWTQLARTTARPPGSGQFALMSRIDEDRLVISLDASGSELPDGQWLEVPASVYMPDGRTAEVHLQPVGPNVYEASISAPETGHYIVAAMPRVGARQLGLVIGGASRTSSPEYRSLTSDITLLRQIAQTTGGRVLDLADPAAAKLFDRTDIPPAIGAVPLWPALLWWTLTFFIIDVAARRLAWNKSTLLHAWHRITHSVQQDDREASGQAAATTERLRQVDRTQTRRARSSSGDESDLSGYDSDAPIPLASDDVVVDDKADEATGQKSEAPTAEELEQRRLQAERDRKKALELLKARTRAQRSDSESESEQSAPAEDDSAPGSLASRLMAQRKKRSDTDTD